MRALGLCLLLTPGVLAAQGTSLLPLGVRIRVSAANDARAGPWAGRRLTGELESVADSIALRDADRGARIALPLAAVSALEVSRGRHASIGTGALVGLGLGGAGCAIAALVAVRANPTDGYDGLAIGLAGIGGGLVGLGLGVVVGALIRTERWESVPLHRLRVALAPLPAGRAGIGVSVPVP